MAIVKCPQCSNKISDKAAVCEHCGYVLEGQDADTIERHRRGRRADKIHKITSQSMLAMLLFIAGIGGSFYFRDETTPDTPWQVQASVVLMVIGFIWYIVNRIRLILVKRQ